MPMGKLDLRAIAPEVSPSGEARPWVKVLGENVWILKALESGRPVGRLMDFLKAPRYSLHLLHPKPGKVPRLEKTWVVLLGRKISSIFPDLSWPFLSLALRNGMGVGTLSSCAALRLDFSHRQIQLLSRRRQINFLGNDFWMFVMYELDI